MTKWLRLMLLPAACLWMATLSAQQINLLESEGISWDFDSAQGWALVDSVSANVDANTVSFETVGTDTTVMRVTAPMTQTGNMSAIISSDAVDTLRTGDHQLKLRFRNAMGGVSTTSGPLEIRCFVQDYATWTNFSPDVVASGQVIGVFKGGGISSSAFTNTPPLSNQFVSDTDTDNDWANSDEWVEVTIGFTLDSILTEKAFKILVRVGTDHTATEDITFEFDYLEWLAPADSMVDDTTMDDPPVVLDTTVFGQNGIDWQFDSAQGWAFVPAASMNAMESDVTFVTVQDTNGMPATVMRVTAPMGMPGAMAAVISSDQIDTIPAGDYNMIFRFRNRMGGDTTTAGALEIRTFIQDFSTWTNFNDPDVAAVGQTFGVFKKGGIGPTWPDASISDTDIEGDFAETKEWVEVKFNFTVTEMLFDKAFKFLVRIGNQHTEMTNVSFEMDYIQWNTGTIALDTLVSLNEIIATNSINLFPNPVSDIATLRFDLTNAADVALAVYTMSGQKVSEVVTRRFVSGTHELEVNTSTLNNGLYIYKLNVNGETVAGKMNVVK